MQEKSDGPPGVGLQVPPFWHGFGAPAGHARSIGIQYYLHQHLSGNIGRPISFCHPR